MPGEEDGAGGGADAEAALRLRPAAEEAAAARLAAEGRDTASPARKMTPAGGGTSCGCGRGSDTALPGEEDDAGGKAAEEAAAALAAEGRDTATPGEEDDAGGGGTIAYHHADGSPVTLDSTAETTVGHSVNDRILDADPGYKGPNYGGDHPLKKVASLPFEGKNKDHYMARAAALQAEADTYAAAMADGSAAAAAAAIGGRYSVVASAAGHPDKPNNFALAEGSDSVADLAKKLHEKDQRDAGVIMTAGQVATEIVVSGPLIGAAGAATKAAFSTTTPTRMGRILAGAKKPPAPTQPPGGKTLPFSGGSTTSPPVTPGAPGGAPSSGTSGVIDYPTTTLTPPPTAPSGPQNFSPWVGAADDAAIQTSGNSALATRVKPAIDYPTTTLTPPTATPKPESIDAERPWGWNKG